jgi:hypothetical protein
MSFVSADEFTVHFDDSGTHSESSIAVGASLVASVDQWRHFNRNWEEAEKQEGFGVFHMADFAAGEKHFKGWDDTKKKRVLERLCNIITTRISVGWSTSVTKKDYDDIIVDPFFRSWVGEFHYSFCVRQCAGTIGIWRRQQKKPSSLEYVFDQMSRGKGEIMRTMDWALDKSRVESRSTGFQPLTGYAFESKAKIWPLQAADIFAWASLQQMHKMISNRQLKWEAELASDLLSRPRLLHWGYFVRDNLAAWAAAEAAALSAHMKAMVGDDTAASQGDQE